MNHSAVGINAPLLGPNSPRSVRLRLPSHDKYDNRYGRHRENISRARSQSVENSSIISGKESVAAAGLTLDPEFSEVYGDPVEGHIAAGRVSGSTVTNDFGNDSASDYDSGSSESEEYYGRNQGVYEYEDDDDDSHGVGAERHSRARSFTSEIGTGNGANPALLFSQNPSAHRHFVRQLGGGVAVGRGDGEEKSQRRRRRRRRNWGRGLQAPTVVDPGDTQSDCGDTRMQISGFDDVNGDGTGGFAGDREGMLTSTRRNSRLEKWFTSPHDHDHDVVSESSHLSEQRRHQHQHHQPRSNNTDFTFSDTPVNTSTQTEATAALNVNDIANDRQDHYPWYSDVAEGGGYVSLSSRLDFDLNHRRATGGDLQLGRSTEEATATVGGAGWLCGSSGLAVFREQLYEEGRSKGKKGNLTSRCVYIG